MMRERSLCYVQPPASVMSAHGPRWHEPMNPRADPRLAQLTHTAPAASGHRCRLTMLADKTSRSMN